MPRSGVCITTAPASAYKTCPGSDASCSPGPGHHLQVVPVISGPARILPALPARAAGPSSSRWASCRRAKITVKSARCARVAARKPLTVSLDKDSAAPIEGMAESEVLHNHTPIAIVRPRYASAGDQQQRPPSTVAGRVRIERVSQPGRERQATHGSHANIAKPG
jgi:hypothetical protein